MYGYTQDLARQRQTAMMREAATFRMTSETRAAHAIERRATFRRVMATAVGLVLWPVKH